MQWWLLEYDRHLGHTLGKPLAGPQVKRNAAQRQFSISSRMAAKVSVLDVGETRSSGDIQQRPCRRLCQDRTVHAPYSELYAFNRTPNLQLLGSNRLGLE